MINVPQVPRSFKERCDWLSKECAVLLAFLLPLSTAGFNLAISFLIPLWLLGGNFSVKSNQVRAHPAVKGAVLLFFVFLMRSFGTDIDPSHTIHTLGKMSKLVYLPFLISLMSNSHLRERALQLFMSAMAITLVLVFLKNILSLPIGLRFGPDGVFKDHIFTSLLMSMAGFIGAHALLETQSFWKRVGFILFLTGVTYYLFFINTGRTGQLIFIGLWGLFGLQRLSWKPFFLSLLLLAALIALAYLKSHPFQTTLKAAIQNVEEYQALGQSRTSVGIRLELMEQTWKLAKKHPWLGAGTGAYSQHYPRHAESNHLVYSDNPHNEYLNIFFQTGLLGLAIFVGYIVKLFKHSASLVPKERWRMQGLLSAMVVGCLFNSWLMDFTSGYFFITFIAYCMGEPLKKSIKHV